jgi:hypothetical protein
MFVEPTAIPVKKPVLFMLATDGADDTQGLVALAVGVPVRFAEAPTHKAVIPEIDGFAFTVIVYTADVQPPALL